VFQTPFPDRSGDAAVIAVFTTLHGAEACAGRLYLNEPNRSPVSICEHTLDDPERAEQ
jgi:hypothetical protein